MVVIGVFFFKQKTAYELRISDWSSDVCSSELLVAHRRDAADDEHAAGELDHHRQLVEEQPREEHREEHLREPEERGALGPELAGCSDAERIGEDRRDDAHAEDGHEPREEDSGQLRSDEPTSELQPLM